MATHRQPPPANSPDDRAPAAPVAGAILIVFGGLPGTGKTTLARALAKTLPTALYLRIDVIEQALRWSGVLKDDVGPAGYEIAYALAASNLKLGRSVIADCVNPVEITRDAWNGVARTNAVPIIEIELICTDQQAHRRRVESRKSDIQGQTLPDWDKVLERHYELWQREHLVIDTASTDIAAALAMITAAIRAAAPPATKAVVC